VKLTGQSWSLVLAGAATLVLAACASRHEQVAAPSAPVVSAAKESAVPPPQSAGPPAVSPQPGASAPAEDLAALGKGRFTSYKCYECHGRNGEGTDDGPNLTGTRLDGNQIAAFLQHPSPDAHSAGMPTIAADSPDLQPLVAYVLSLKRSSSLPR